MSGKLIDVTASAYQFPLLIKHLLHSSMLHAADQEIVYRDQKRFTYHMLRDRIGRLASGLKELGVRPGDTVGVMDWDTHRFLEAFFAIPMMGAILQTVNVRLSHEQIIYTIEHAGATTLLVNDEFLRASRRDSAPPDEGQDHHRHVGQRLVRPARRGRRRSL